jgi:hypothetical protein
MPSDAKDRQRRPTDTSSRRDRSLSFPVCFAFHSAVPRAHLYSRRNWLSPSLPHSSRRPTAGQGDSTYAPRVRPVIVERRLRELRPEKSEAIGSSASGCGYCVTAADSTYTDVHRAGSRPVAGNVARPRPRRVVERHLTNDNARLTPTLRGIRTAGRRRPRLRRALKHPTRVCHDEGAEVDSARRGKRHLGSGPDIAACMMHSLPAGCCPGRCCRLNADETFVGVNLQHKRQAPCNSLPEGDRCFAGPVTPSLPVLPGQQLRQLHVAAQCRVVGRAIVGRRTIIYAALKK